MKEQKLYVCDYCGTQYKDKVKAMACEKGHRTPEGIANTTYHAGGDFPDRVEVAFKRASEKQRNE